MICKALTFAAVFVSTLLVSEAQAAKKRPVKTSKISAFGGSSSGSAVFSISGAPAATGFCSASFAASKRQEVGTLNLSSTVTGAFIGGVQEIFKFRKGRLSYFLSLPTGTGTGSGTARISKNVITYSATMAFSDFVYVVQGTIHQSKRRLLVTESITTAGEVAVFTYKLTRRGGRR